VYFVTDRNSYASSVSSCSVYLAIVLQSTEESLVEHRTKVGSCVSYKDTSIPGEGYSMKQSVKKTWDLWHMEEPYVLSVFFLDAVDTFFVFSNLFCSENL
jgi:hypothetical protein